MRNWEAAPQRTFLADMSVKGVGQNPCPLRKCKFLLICPLRPERGWRGGGLKVIAAEMAAIMQYFFLRLP